MNYHDRLWANAPEGATICIVHEGMIYWGAWAVLHLDAVAWGDINQAGEVRGRLARGGPLVHPRPTAYRTADQLIEEYREEHGAEIEEWLDGVDKGLPEESLKEAESSIWLAARYSRLADYLLAAERARIEKETKNAE